MRLGLASLLVVLLFFSCHPQSVLSQTRNTTEADDLATLTSHRTLNDDSSPTSRHTFINSRTNNNESSGHSTTTPKYISHSSSYAHDHPRTDKDDSAESGSSAEFTPHKTHESIMLKSRELHRDNLTVGNLKAESPYQRKKLTVGYLTAVRGDMKERQGLAVSGAIKMAIDKV